MDTSACSKYFLRKDKVLLKTLIEKSVQGL